MTFRRALLVGLTGSVLTGVATILFVRWLFGEVGA